jgi:hypothetical protein
MPARYVTVDRETALLLPPDLRDWVPSNHLVHLIHSDRGRVGVGKQDADHNPGLFDQRPGEKPKKSPLLPVSSKMAQPFWLSSVLSKSDTLLAHRKKACFGSAFKLET